MSTDSGIISPPKVCSCGAPATLITIEVYNQEGSVRRGAFSEFGSIKGRTKKRRILRPQYRFKQWVPECLACIEQQRNQAGVFG